MGEWTPYVYVQVFHSQLLICEFVYHLEVSGALNCITGEISCQSRGGVVACELCALH